MAVLQTTLAAAVTASDLSFTITSATSMAAGNIWRCDGEYGLVSPSYVSGVVLPVYRRGDQGTTALAHNILAIFDYGTPTDWANLALAVPPPGVSGPWPPPAKEAEVTYSVSGAIAVPQRDTVAIINKTGSAAVMTIAAPTLDQDRMRLTITSVTAVAHTVTGTSLLSTGGSGVSLATFAANKGSGMVLMAMQGLWNVISSQGITFT